MSTSVALIIAVALLAANAFFVGSEFAILSVRRAAMEPLAEGGHRGATRVIWAMERLSLMLACAQLGVTLCSVGLGAIAEPAIAHAIEGPMQAMGIPDGAVHPISFAIALFFVVYLHVVIGEMVPKNISVSAPDKAALVLIPPLTVISKVLGPVVVVINWLANHILRATGVTPKDEVASAFSVQEVQSIVDRSRQEGVLRDDEGLLTGALEFSELNAAQVMVPMSAVVTVPPDVTPDQIEDALRRTGFSRFVVANSDGDALGYVHIKDVLDATDFTASKPVDSAAIRPLPRVSASVDVEDVLARMQRTGAHLVRVVDGEKVVGIVFLEDILEELVGEVHDDMQRHHVHEHPPV
ncbi:hemolysin family protein [Rarobacter incanus]|uniref:CBS domain containing-hemolysin-like protein n=1 Tax=Rarobacter incanus TaxID=153494 RepID=A0A542SRC6_9MICO|nr:hemolysin family protein [Rarobacter incanus]TQK77169.1 CBS domain containing-hemolysin-like protein [Rarobacter incanus]